MAKRLNSAFETVSRVMANCLARPVCLGALPAACLVLYWLGGEVALMVAAITAPLVFMLAETPPPLRRRQRPVEKRGIGDDAPRKL